MPALGLLATADGSSDTRAMSTDTRSTLVQLAAAGLVVLLSLIVVRVAERTK